jgi:hypothetical protein
VDTDQGCLDISEVPTYHVMRFAKMLVTLVTLDISKVLQYVVSQLLGTAQLRLPFQQQARFGPKAS